MPLAATPSARSSRQCRPPVRVERGRTADALPKLFQSLDGCRFREEGIGDWTVVFDRFVVDAARLLAGDEVIDDPGSGDSVNGNEL